MQTFNIGGTPPLTFGAGQMRKVPAIIARMERKNVLVIADTILADLGVTDRLKDGLNTRGLACDVAAVVAGEPKESLVDELCQRARDSGADVVIGIGGGAAMDASKLVATISPCGRPAKDFALAANPLPQDGLAAIAIPTTAGTGSEVTRTAIVSDSKGWKNWFFGEELMFAQAILDPELTVSLPAHLTAWTGIDAVAHALEGATARSTNAAGSLYGLEALRLLRGHLPRAVADGTDIEARGHVLWASMVAGLALHNCNTHMGHNISHAMGSLARVHHGLATGLGLEASLPWLVQRPEGAENYARAAEALGGAREATALPGALSDLMRACEIPAELPAACAGVTAEALANEMRNSANIGMSQNAACDLSPSDLDEMAILMMNFPISSAA